MVTYSDAGNDVKTASAPNAVDVTANYHHGDLRKALLDTARALATESGIDGFSLREVSRRAGVSHAAAYNHFADRSALVEALVLEAFEGLARALERAEKRVASPLDRLQNIGIAYVKYAFSHQAEFRFMFRPELFEKRRAKTGIPAQAANRRAYAVLRRAIAAAADAGDIAAGDAEAATLTAWSVVHGLSTIVLDSPNKNLAKSTRAVVNLARVVTEITNRGIRNPLPYGGRAATVRTS